MILFLAHVCSVDVDVESPVRAACVFLSLSLLVRRRKGADEIRARKDLVTDHLPTSLGRAVEEKPSPTQLSSYKDLFVSIVSTLSNRR